MQFDSLGNYGAGVKGDGGVVSVNSGPVAGPSAQFGGFLGGGVVVCQAYASGVPPTIRAFPGNAELAPRGANTLFADGGVWAGWLAGFGLFSSTGFNDPAARLLAVGPDGAIAYCPDSGFPIRVREVSGEDWLLSESPAQSVRLYGLRRATLYNNSAARSSLVVVGLTAPVGLPVKFYGYTCTPDGEWCAYQDETGGGRVVVRRTADASQGWVIPAPLAYGIALDVRGVTVRVGFARREGEQPGDLFVQSMSGRAMVALVAPPIDPPIDPPKEPVVSVPDVKAFVHGFLGPRIKVLATPEATDANCFAALNACCAELRKSDKRWYLLEKTSGHQQRNRTVDVLAYDLGDGTCQLVKVMRATDAAPELVWTLIGVDQVGIRPIAQAKEPYPVSDQPPVDDPPVKPATCTCAKEIAELKLWALDKFAGLGQATAEDVEALGVRIAALENAPKPVADLTGYVAEGDVKLPYGLGGKHIVLPLVRK